jgi:hypothetical protein
MFEWLTKHVAPPRAQVTRTERIASSNFIVAALRRRLVEPLEVYVKWWYGGAYNGCAWTSKSRNDDVYFSEVRPHRGTAARERAKQFNGVWISTSVPFEPPANLEDFLKQTEDDFKKAISADPTLLQRVARLQVWYWFRAPGSNEAIVALAEFAESLAKAIPGELAMTPPWSMPGPEPMMNADIEIALRQPAGEDVVIGVLQSLMPGFSGTLFGMGATWHSPAGTCGALVTGRQF